MFGMHEKIAQHAFQIRKDVVVPIPDDDHTFLGEPARAAIIGLLLLFGMLPTIDFNGEAEARAIEVKRKWADRVLPSKMQTFELIATQRLP
jgi:hypothetical protein